MQARIYDRDVDITPQFEGIGNLITPLGELPNGDGELWEVEFPTIKGVYFPREVYPSDLI
jgi:hypothetical protein